MKNNENVVICPPCGERACPRRFLSGGALATKRGCLTNNAAFSVPLVGKMPCKGKRGLPNKETSFTPSLPRYTVLPPQGGQITARAFTLIELLVVVLIIGILAAVAVPQYKKAVTKSRFISLRVHTESLAKTIQTYYLANGKWPKNFSDLEVELLHGNTTNLSSGECQYNDNNSFYCCIQAPQKNYSFGGIFCGLADASLAYQHIYVSDDGKPRKEFFCYQKSDLNLCGSLMGAKGLITNATIHDGNGSIHSNYERYTIN